MAPRPPGRQPRIRLDQLLVERGLAASRAEALRLVLAGRVRAGGEAAGKAGRLVRRDLALELTTAPRFVGRGGEKLAAALTAFRLAVAGRVCLDVGASTGGFTDCLLAAGARRVHAVDVGRGQLDARLRADPRVHLLEQCNARSLEAGMLGERVTLATVDVAFISLAKVLPAVAGCLAEGGEVVALVKPQFEVGRGRVGRGGVVREPRLHREAILSVAAAAGALGLGVRGVIPSPLRGPKGNREFFLHLAPGPGGLPAEAVARVATVAAEVPDPAPAAEPPA